MPITRHYAVIGGGWSGCAAAITLAQAGQRVSLFEAGRTLGGRARCVNIDGRQLDNGQHILLGAYRATLAMMRAINIDTKQVLLRLPLQIRYPSQVGSNGMQFVAPRLPAPWHMLAALLKAQGLTRADKLALARFSTTTRWMDWQLHQDCSVAALLERYQQTENLIKLIWVPLCIAALNTPPQRASAQVFLNVLRDSLGAHRAASDMLIPRTDLTTLFPTQAANFITQRNGSITCGRIVQSLSQTKHDPSTTRQWQLTFKQHTETPCVDGIVIATGAQTAAELLNDITDTTALRALQYEAISTCYLQYPPQLRLPHPFYTLLDHPQQSAWGQFVFDRGQLTPTDAGLLAVVISTAGDAIAQGHTALIQGITAQLAHQFDNPALHTPRWSQVISEKRASFSCTPSLTRPNNASMPPGITLAGDYLVSSYPSTLEAAIRSGIDAAHILLQT